MTITSTQPRALTPQTSPPQNASDSKKFEGPEYSSVNASLLQLGKQVAMFGECATTTFVAFMAPTIVAPLLFQSPSWVRFLSMGVIFTDRQHQLKQVRFQPPTTDHEHMVATGLFLSPFVFTAGVRGMVARHASMHSDGLPANVAKAIDGSWQAMIQKNHPWLRCFPKFEARLQSYPASGILATVAGQLLGCVLGTGGCLWYHQSWRRAEIEPVPPDASGPRWHERISNDPLNYVVGTAPFLFAYMADKEMLPLVVSLKSDESKVKLPRLRAGLRAALVTGTIAGGAAITALTQSRPCTSAAAHNSPKVDKSSDAQRKAGDGQG